MSEMDSYGRFSRPEWDFLLHDESDCAKRYREGLTGLLSIYPAGGRNDLEGRLCSGTTSGFRSACMELRLFGLLRAIGDVEVHPTIGNTNRHPDFRVTTNDGDVFVEAVLALDRDEEREQQERFRLLLDSIDSLNFPFSVWVQGWTGLTPGFDIAPIVEFLREQLSAQALRETSGAHVLTYREETQQGRVEVDFEVWSREEAVADGLVELWGPGRARAVTTHEKIRWRVRNKATRYGELGAPFVVAIWPGEEFPPIEGTVLAGLYGDVQVTLSLVDKSYREIGRTHNGAFNTIAGGRTLNTEVGAAAVYWERLVDRGWEHFWFIYHNPYADRPVSANFFGNIPQFVFERSGNGLNGHWLDGRNPWATVWH